MLHEELTSTIIAAFYAVYNELGYGFLEKVYENAMLFELQQRGVDAKQQFPIKVHYQQQIVGEYFADLMVNDLVIIELKAADQISEAHEAQLINYLKATDVEVGLVLNFGPKAGFKRKIFTNSRKRSLKVRKGVGE